MSIGRLGMTLFMRLNQWFIDTAGGDDRQSILDIDATVPALRRVERAHKEIRAEALDLLNNLTERAPTIQDVEGNRCIAARTPNDWRVYWFWSIGEKVDENCARCPETVKVLSEVPGLWQAHFSVLDPGKSVQAHIGRYGGWLRYHLGLIVPTENPPKLRVHDQFHTWREGESVLFDDTREHEVINTCAEPRVVLVLDVTRPMPLPQTIVHWLAVRAARRFYARPMMDRARELAGNAS